MARNLTKLDPKKTLFLLCDIQDKFRPVMKHFDNMVVNVNKLLKAGEIMGVPVIATEQYPEKLGRIPKEVDTCNVAAVFPKTRFSMMIPELECKIDELFPNEKPKNIVIFGLETHICVEQTSMDFIEKKYNVNVVADCCCSRLNQDRDLALQRLRSLGCVVTTSESVIFNLLRDKNHPKFNDVRKLVSKVSADMDLSKESSSKAKL